MRNLLWQCILDVLVELEDDLMKDITRIRFGVGDQGSFLNLKALTSFLVEMDKGIIILCARVPLTF